MDPVYQLGENISRRIARFAPLTMPAGSPRALQNFLANILFIGAAGVVLQGFMSYRIWVVSERRWRVWPACSILLSLAAFGVAIW